MAVKARSDVFRHEALLYSGEREFLDGTLPFIEQGLAENEFVLVVVGEDKIRHLEAALGPDADSVRFADMDRVGRNPARIIPLWRQLVDEGVANGRAVRGIGEPTWPGRTPAELAECRRHEALLNVAFADAPAWTLLCPYDAAGLGPEVVRAAEQTHPHVAQLGAVRESAAYDPAEGERPFAGSLPDPPGDAAQLQFTREGVGRVRNFVSKLAIGAGLDLERAADLVLAMDELATNSVRHAGSEGRVRGWLEGETLVCEVEDAGRIDDPLAGRVQPLVDESGGRGLWLVNQVCDLVQIRSALGHTAVRVHMRTD
jgi:anti-sigma regulatory factor (Ser/Thr protein kinase)